MLAAAPLAAQDPASRAPAANRTAAARATGPGSSVSERGARGEMSIDREVFAYESGGAATRSARSWRAATSSRCSPTCGSWPWRTTRRRRLGGDPARPRHEGAVPRAAGTLLGRMRVAQIRAKSVVFTIEELGYSRQETLGLSDHTAARSK
jgi:hypothetical protein